MSAHAWLTLVVLALTVFVLARDLIAPSLAVLGAVVVLLLAGVITSDQALAGFSNAAPITVAALYVVARAVEKSGALQPLVTAVLGDRQGERWRLARLLAPAAGASAFLNNTPLVAMLAPQVAVWAERRGRPPSAYLMPLSYAVILGGVVTLIGTSTNIVVSGLLQASGHPPIGMFELTKVGLPLAVAGVTTLVLLAPVLLPSRRSAIQQFEADLREFVVQMEVEPSGPLVGKTVAAGGLRHLQGVFLAQVERSGQVIAPAGPTTVLRGGDRLTFVGRADLVRDLQSTRGLRSAEHRHAIQFNNSTHRFFEAVVSQTSPLVGKTLRDTGFRGRYQAAVLAIHRAGARVDAKLGEVELKAGDTLLLVGDPGFRNRWHDRNDFLLVSTLGGTQQTSPRKALLVGLITMMIVLSGAFNFLPTLQATLVGALALVALGVVTPSEARNAVDVDVILVIAASFGLSAAIQSSGLAAILGHGIVEWFSGWGPVAVLLAVVLATAALTELITNNAAAALLFPIAIATAADLGLNPRPFAIAVAMMASTSFLTPIGYQTNMMVYGPGGYRFGDYARLGAPLTALSITIIVCVVPIFWPL